MKTLFNYLNKNKYKSFWLIDWTSNIPLPNSEVSIFSKAFYTYMTAICQGASGNYSRLADFRSEMQRLLSKSKQKDSHIGAFVLHRIQLFPNGDEAMSAKPQNQYFWKYLVYEVLFLWSALCNASTVELTCIVAGKISRTPTLSDCILCKWKYIVIVCW